MAANDLEYGWYKWEDGFRQKDGFFTDRSGNILYWPTRKGPGYVMDDAAIEAVGQHKEQQEKIRRRGRLIAATVVIVSYIFLDETIRRYVEFFVLPIAIFAAIVLEEVAGAVILRRWDLDLSHRPMIYEPRPVVRDTLVAAKTRPRDEFWMPIAARVLLALALIAIGFFFFDTTLARWFSGVATKTILDQGTLWSLGVVGFLALAWQISQRIKARLSPIETEEVRSRILVADGLEDRSLWYEEDVERLERPFHIDANDARHGLYAIGTAGGSRASETAGRTSSKSP